MIHNYIRAIKNPEEKADKFTRILVGLLCVLIALAPLYLGSVLLIGLLTGKEPLNIDIFIGMGITVLIASPFLLLAYRLFTGKARKKDGGLIHPFLIILFSIIIIIISLISIYAVPKEEFLGSLIPVIVFLLLGVSGLVFAFKRIKK